MSFQFPPSPEVGEQVEGPNGFTYEWNGTGWVTLGGGGASPFPEPPQSPDIIYGRENITGTGVWANIAGKYLPLPGGTLTGNLRIDAAAGVNSTFTLNKPSTGFANWLTGAQAGVNRWRIHLGTLDNEAGGNVGSNFWIQRFTDTGVSTGAFAQPALMINRVDGVCTFSAAIVNGPSDRSLKENIEPIEDALDKVMALQGVSFDWISNGRRDIGLIAQDVEPIVPEIIQTFQTADSDAKLALDYPKLTALLIEAVKELSARVVALEGAR